MLNKVVIGTLSVCLVSIIVGYLYSEYAPTPKAATAPVSVAPLSPSDHSAVSKRQEVREANQPDSSFPIPAHQLKKLVNAPESVSLSKNIPASLASKIQSADQTIASIDQKLGADDLVKNTAAETDKNVRIENQKTDVEKRIDHIQQHLKQ